MRQAGHTRRSFAEADLQFHLAVGAASKNPLIRSMAGVIEAALLASFSLSSPLEGRERQQESADEHEQIVHAIVARDPVAAAAAMLKVIDVGDENSQRARRTTPSAQAGA
jgi:DNA-binding FadR family transcriptional regulator